MNKVLFKKSDKEYWHRFSSLYQKILSKIDCGHILEFGVFEGDSIRWLNQIFPKAKIYGSDILDKQDNWPIGENIQYFYVNQDSPISIKKMFSQINNKLDLIIEDGSHLPRHQKNCLIESLKHISSGGIYILEDIHTSHPEHLYYKREKIFRSKKKQYISAFHLLLCFEHLIANNLELNDKLINKLSINSLFTNEEILFIYQKISNIKVYKRSTLPHYCYACHSSDFDYHNLMCKCGVDLYSNSDSMAIIITSK